MADGILGLIVTGGEPSPLAALGVHEPRALTPFAGQYRVVDFALATATNSGIPHVSLVPERDRDPARFPRVLAACQRAAATCEPEWLVVLRGDHILQADLRPALRALAEARYDLALLALALPEPDPKAHPRITGADGADLCWSGDFLVRAAALPRLLRAFERSVGDQGHAIGILRRTVRMLVHDLRGAAAHAVIAPYWHEPTTLEAYYASQMDLCTPAPRLDLYDPSWPIRATSTGLPPAKVSSDAACGHRGQAINALLADGCVIRGGSVIRSVMGPGCVVDAGAEVEDSILLDGCHVGRGAHVRRALIGPGVVVHDGEDIGYDEPLRPGAERLTSGLTAVPTPTIPSPLVATAH